MCMTNEAAAIKLAERDNLVGELVEAMQEAYTHLINGDIQHGTDVICTAIAKAREGDQS